MAHRQKLNQLIELGVARVNWDGMLTQDAITALAQESARHRLQAATSPSLVDDGNGGAEPAAAAIAALTDSSGGTAANPLALAAVVTPTRGVVDGVASFSPKAGFDTATTAIENAHEEIGLKLNAMLNVILGADGDGNFKVYGIDAAATPDGTIEAITAALTAATSGCVEADSGIAEINKIRNYQATLCAALNYLRVAVGLAPITDGTGGLINKEEDQQTPAGWGWSVDAWDRAETGTAATTNEDTLTDATVDAALTAARNNISTLASAVNALRGNLDMGARVVATKGPRTRLVPAFDA